MTERKVNALTYTPPPVEINGTKYSRRRLGIMDELKLVELIFNAGVRLDIDPNRIKDLSIGEIGGHLYSLMNIALDEVLGFLRGILVDFPLSVEEMKDPDKFPLGSLEAIIESIVADKDVEAFFARIRSLLSLKDNFAKITPSRNKSSPSKKKRGGPTKR